MLSRVLALSAKPCGNTVIASDMTQIAYAATAFSMYVPRTWLHPWGFGTLGFGLPPASAPNSELQKPVAIMIGDYASSSLSMNWNRRRHNCRLLILIWNNNALGQIRDDMGSKGIQPNAVTRRTPISRCWQKPMCYAEKPASLKALAAAIKTALNADGPTFIEMTPAMVNG